MSLRQHPLCFPPRTLPLTRIRPSILVIQTHLFPSLHPLPPQMHHHFLRVRCQFRTGRRTRRISVDMTRMPHVEDRTPRLGSTVGRSRGGGMRRRAVLFISLDLLALCLSRLLSSGRRISGRSRRCGRRGRSKSRNMVVFVRVDTGGLRRRTTMLLARKGMRGDLLWTLCTACRLLRNLQIARGYGRGRSLDHFLLRPSKRPLVTDG